MPQNPSQKHSDDEDLSDTHQPMRFLFIDFNAYFASVEQHDDPALRDKPVMVTPSASEYSGAIAVSYEAKALGIKRGTSVREARQICPDIAVRPARHDRYVILHNKLMHEIERHLPIRRVHSVDECVCFLSAQEADVEAAKRKALEIKDAIRENIGPSLRMSIGLASSTMLAKLASDLHKPDGLSAIETHTLPEALADLPLRNVPGIGKGVAHRLARANVTTFTQLWNLAPKQARAIWGSVAGERLLHALKGHDAPDPPEPKKRMIGHSRVLSGKHRHLVDARIVARALLLRAASRLRRNNLHAGAMHVAIKLYPEGKICCEVKFRRTQNTWRFLHELDHIWAQFDESISGATSRHNQLKQVTIYLCDLHDAPPENDLFIPEEFDSRDALQAGLWNTIDCLNRRYGGQKIRLASQQGLDLNYLGVKIAFSRVPDLAEFSDLT